MRISLSSEPGAETPEETRLGHVTLLTRETRCTRLRVWCVARCPRRWPQQRHHAPLLRPYGPFRLRSSHELLPRSRLPLNSTNLSSKLSCATGSTKSSCIQHYFLGFSSLRGEHGVRARVTFGCYRSDHQQSHIRWRRSLRAHYLLLYCANPMSRVSPLVFQPQRRTHCIVCAASPTPATSPSKSLTSAFQKQSTIHALLTYLASSLSLAALHLLITSSYDATAESHARISLFVKSRSVHAYARAVRVLDRSSLGNTRTISTVTSSTSSSRKLSLH